MKDSKAELQFSEKLLSEVIAERRATPSFDGTPIPEKVLLEIIKAGIESPSGSNLQPWRFVVVSTLEQKKRLREAAMNQPKVEEAGAVIVFCGDLDATYGDSLEDMLKESVKHGFSEEQKQIAREKIIKTFSNPAGNAMGLNPDYAVWLNRHVMIAFTTMMWRAETLGYDTAPMEGFFEDKVKLVLNIPDKIRIVALLAIGKRKGPDKPYSGRRQLSDLCFMEKWGEGVYF